MVRVRLLGDFSLATPEGPVLLPPKLRLVAAYLSWQQGRWVKRSTLCGIFWGEVDTDRASQSLRTALHSLHRALLTAGAPEAALGLRRDAVRFADDGICSVDAHLFEEAAAAGLAQVRSSPNASVGITCLTSAASLYGGSFMADADLDLMTESDWCAFERRRLADTFETVLRSLVEALAAAGLHHSAIEYARRWRDIDPLSEEACRALMGQYAAIGRPGQAAEEFERCRTALQDQLGVSPSPATLRLLEETGLAGRRAHPSDETMDPPGVRAGEPLSRDPLRNAGLLMVSGEEKVLHGGLAEGILDLQQASAIYRRLGDETGDVRARLAIARALVGCPTDRRPAEALECVEPVIDCCRRASLTLELASALQVASQAAQECGRYEVAVAWAREGLEVAERLDRKDIRARIALSLAIALTHDYQLVDARQAWDLAMEDTVSAYRPHELLLAHLHRTSFEITRGDCRTAEHYVREALALLGELPKTAQTLPVESMLHWALMLVLAQQERQTELHDFVSRAEPHDYAFPGQAAMESILLMRGDPPTILRAAADSFRATHERMPDDRAGAFLRLLVEYMIDYDLPDDARRWSAVALRAGRHSKGGANLANFYSMRGVALAKSGHIDGAKRCLASARRAGENDHGCRWTEPWIDHLAGLIAHEQGDYTTAKRRLAKSREQFERIGTTKSVRRIEAEMVRLGL